MKTITVWHNDEAITISQEVAAKHNLVNNSRLFTEAKFREVLGDNCKANIAFCESKLAEQKLLQGVTDWLAQDGGGESL